MIALAVWLMRVGLREDRTAPFAAGVLYFLLWALLRYADLFAGVGGMLGAALMFLLCGVGLFAFARFWTHRQEPLPAALGRGAGGEGGEAGQVENGLSLPDALTLTLFQMERGTGVFSSSQRERGRGHAFLFAGYGLQLVVLVGMMVGRMMLLWTGETVLLRVVPIDPRDIFRGDYVTLTYDISRVPTQGILGLPPSFQHSVALCRKPAPYNSSWQRQNGLRKAPARGGRPALARGRVQSPAAYWWSVHPRYDRGDGPTSNMASNLTTLRREKA